MTRVALLGDSVFDNGRYVSPGPGVAQQLAEHFPVHMIARDGAVTTDIKKQLRRLDGDETHLVLSVGGNDALKHQRVLRETVRSMSEALGRMGDIRDQFECDYSKMLSRVAAVGVPVIALTIYRANFASDGYNFIADTAVSLFNDVIQSQAARYSVQVLDTRRVFTLPADYANEIEPSVHGGEKLVHEIGSMLAMTRLQDIAAHLRAAATRVEIGDEEGALARLQRAKRMIKRKQKRRDLMGETSITEQLENSLDQDFS